MNKIKKNTSSLLIILIILISNSLYAQAFNWGDTDIDIAKEKNVMYTDALKSKHYESALTSLVWLHEHKADLNKSIYINGEKIYKQLAKTEDDAAKKEMYIQKGLDLFDKRVENFDEPGTVADRKASFAYTFYNKNKEKYAYLFELFEKAHELNREKMSTGNLVAYMNVIYKHRFAGATLSDEEVIDRYSEISEALASQRDKAKPESKEKYKKMMGQVDKLLTATKVEISCDFVVDKLGPKMEETGDIKMAKKVFDLLLKGKCLDNPLALKSAEIIHESEPTFTIAKFMAQKNLMNDNFDEALRLYTEAASLTTDQSEKADTYLDIARIHMKRGKKSTTRDWARKALKLNPGLTSAHRLIGDLYMTSFEQCSNKVSQIEDRAVFIAAYHQYKKAGHSAGMTNAKNQFPAIEQIFNEGKKEGDPIAIKCWINTTVKLEKRPN